jgi:RNA polymerase sigma factor (sigma-70 family)
MDRVFLEEFRAGKRAALERIYQEHVDGVEALARAGLRHFQRFSPANLADVVQEVFAKAFSPKARAAYDGEREYGPFLRQLARNTLVDWLRKSGREVPDAADLEHISAQDLSTDPSGEPFSAELVATVERFVRALPPDLRGVHEHRFLAAESQERAAAALGITRQNLRTLEQRLLQDLRREIRRAEADGRQRVFSQPTQRVKPY